MYSVGKWEKDFKKKEGIMKNIMCDYPFILGGHSTATNNQNEEMIAARSSFSGGSVRGILEYRDQTGGVLPRVSSSHSNLRSMFRTGLGELRNATSRGLTRQAEVLDENRIVLYKKGKQLGNKGYYIVEISSNNDYMFIAAYDVESPESYLIELPEKKA